MALRRALIGLLATFVVFSTSLATGSGAASAVTGREILAAAEELAPTLMSRFSVSANELKPLFVRQASALTPVQDGADLKRLQAAWAEYVPRQPRPDEIIAVRQEVPSAVKKANDMLCETAFDLATLDDVASWEYAVGRVSDEIQASNPIGRRLALYTELNDITAKFRSGCYCAGTAQLAVFLAKQRYC